MIIYIGFILEQGKLLPEFVTDNVDIAKVKAIRSVDDALPNNMVKVFQAEFDERKQLLMTASWTPEGETITLAQGWLSKISKP